MASSVSLRSKEPLSPTRGSSNSSLSSLSPRDTVRRRSAITLTLNYDDNQQRDDIKDGDAAEITEEDVKVQCVCSAVDFQKTLKVTGPVPVQELLRLFHAQLHHPTLASQNRITFRKILDRITVIEESERNGKTVELVVLNTLSATPKKQ